MPHGVMIQIWGRDDSKSSNSSIGDDDMIDEARAHLKWLKKTACDKVDNARIIGYEDCLREWEKSAREQPTGESVSDIEIDLKQYIDGAFHRLENATDTWHNDTDSNIFIAEILAFIRPYLQSPLHDTVIAKSGDTTSIQSGCILNTSTPQGAGIGKDDVLLPCPFCGVSLKGKPQYMCHEINDCILAAFAWHESKTAAWNTRAAMPRPATGWMPIESAAKYIYEAMQWAVRHSENGRFTPDWQENGNSHAQDRARAAANIILSPAPEGE